MKSVVFSCAIAVAAGTQENFDELISEVRGHSKGYFDDRQEIKTFGPGYRGIVATQSIFEGDLLATIPSSLILRENEHCGLIQRVMDEMSKEPPSAYMASMKQYDPSIPNSWHKDALSNIADLPPFDWTRHTEWFRAHCISSESSVSLSDEQLRALYLTVGRACGHDGDHVMAPIYDLYNHRNGHGHNTEIRWGIDGDGESMQIHASRDIEIGEEICHSYGLSTPSMLRDYGFVEQSPQHWDIIVDHPFNLDESDIVQWTKGPPEMEIFDEIAKSIRTTLESSFTVTDHVDQEQISMAVEYRKAMAHALQVAQEDLMERQHADL